MNASVDLVVFDCNVHFQALISHRGPSNGCLSLAAEGRVQLVCSEYTIYEIRDISSRSHLRKKFDISDQQVDAYVNTLRRIATFLDQVPHRYSVRSDPDDSHYINLALAADARLIVSRDRDLLRLTTVDDFDGREFRRLYPTLLIMDPLELLRRVKGESGM